MLARDPSTFVDQDRFGGSHAPPGERGNCFQVCVATILGLPLDQVPHFYGTDGSVEEQTAAVQHWLAARGWFRLATTWEWIRDGYFGAPLLPADSLVIVSGKSPRGDWEHAVVGRVENGAWTLVHDPHPSKAGIVGEPTCIEVIAPLPFLGKVS